MIIFQSQPDPMGTSDPEPHRYVERDRLGLDGLTTCPKCGISFTALQDSLETSPKGSDDLTQTLILIENCAVCKIRFRRR